ncbi:MAG: hypothetical protein H7A40_05600 [Chlamydiales bacterium]|nr:hypothetical protein [Chlamydiales bacterium]
MTFNFITNPIGTTARFLTTPLGGEDSACLAEWVGRIGAVSMIALFAIGVFATQVSAVAALGLSIIPIAAVMVVLFGLIWVISSQSRTETEAIELQKGLSQSTDKLSEKIDEATEMVTHLRKAKSQRLAEAEDSFKKYGVGGMPDDPQMDKLKEQSKILKKQRNAATDRAEKSRIRAELEIVRKQMRALLKPPVDLQSVS